MINVKGTSLTLKMRRTMAEIERASTLELHAITPATRKALQRRGLIRVVITPEKTYAELTKFGQDVLAAVRERYNGKLSRRGDL